MTLKKTCILAFTSIFLSAIQAFSPDQSIQAKDHPFGPNVYIMYPTDDMTKVHETVEKIHDEMFKEHFGDGRYAILFAPGDYREAGLMKVPFFVHMAGLGKTPYDVKLSNVHTPVHLANDNGTCTFWRSLENLSVIGQESYEEDEMFKWAVSQAAPIRRVYSERTVKNQWKNGWVSGGFTADCHFMGAAGSDGQQQWYTRNTYLDKGRGRFREGSWNYMFQGVELGEGADKSTYVNNWDKGGNVTFLPSTPVIREKPFIFMDEKGRFKVFKPALRRDAVGVSYSRESMGEGEIIDIKKDFYIVAPGTSAKQINKQLARGKHILFQPGIFELEEPLHVTKAGTIVMGLGWSTLIPGKGNEEAALIVDDLDDVTVCSILFDAYYTSHSLLTMRGEGRQHDAHPSLLSDVFFRVGGVVPHPVHVDTALEIQANDVVGDHFWIWRADHGLRNSVGWEVNTSDIGLHVTGDDVTIYGLFNEHFQKYQTLWEGERGRTYFYQCETPYDAGYQSRYMSENGTRAGYCAYKVADSVDAHEATGLGIYDVYFGTDIRMENSMEVPEKPGIRIFHLCNVSLSDSGPRGIGYMINGRVASTFQTYRVCRPYINEFVGGAIDAYHEGSNESSIKTLENWQFSSDSTSWASVTVPHSYNAIDGHSKSYYRGKGYYTTTVSLKEVRCAKLLFEGAAQAATVYVNGRLAASHKGGYTPFFGPSTILKIVSETGLEDSITLKTL